MSEIFSILVMALWAWGFTFIGLRALGWIEWHYLWVMSPIFLGTIIYITMVVIAFALGGGFE